MKQDILSESSSSEDEGGDVHQLTINEHFAKAYEYRKEREELAKRAFRSSPQLTPEFSFWNI